MEPGRELRAKMTSSTDGTLLVPIANTETAERLIDTAADLARDHSYRILVVYVVEVPAQLPLTEGDRLVDDEDEAALAYAVDLAEEAGVPIESRTRYARDVATGIVGGVDEHDVDLLLMGWRGRPPRRNIVLGSYLDKVLQEAPCDVLVKRIQTPQPAADSVLVPVADGPHNEFATEIAGSVARQQGASVHLLHVVDSDASDDEREEGERLLADAEETLADGFVVTRELVESDHVAGAITDATAEHDLTVVGATQKSALRERFLGSVSEAVGRNAAGTVVLAQRKL